MLQMCNDTGMARETNERVAGNDDVCSHRVSHWDLRPRGDIPVLRQDDRKDIEEGNMAAGGDSDTKRLERRTGRARGVGVLAALEGAALIVWNLIATPFIGRRRLRWGMVGTEATDSLPGDELVPEPEWSYTLGIAVDSAPKAKIRASSARTRR